MITEPYRTRLKQAVGDIAAIDAIHREAMIAHPELFRPFVCSECVKSTQTGEGDLMCRGKALQQNSAVHCAEFRPRRFS